MNSLLTRIRYPNLHRCSAVRFTTVPQIEPITHKSVWYGPQLSTSDWEQTLTEAEIRIISQLSDYVVSRSTSVNEINLESIDTILQIEKDQSCVGLRNLLKDLSHTIHEGIGFKVIHGLSVDTWTTKKLGAAFLILGSLMGNLRKQNALGHVLGHVKDLGLSSTDPRVRVYQTNERQTFHTDSCDIVGLLCLKVAKRGGHSAMVSCGTIFNEMLKFRPDLAHTLLDPVPTDRRGEIPPGCLPYYMIPVFSLYQGALTAIYQRQYIDSSQRLAEAPRLTPKQVEALDLFDKLADDPRLNFTTQLLPGDMLFCYNHTLLHDRTAFEDYPDEERARHLFRMWLATKEARPLPEVFTERFGSVTIGDRGGVNIPGVAPIATLTAAKLAH